MESRLDTTNSDHITYEHPPLDIAVPGGIPLSYYFSAKYICH
ncbi:MAG: hypothetical protein AAF600_19885 [Bacteroidota bacterium]